MVMNVIFCSDSMGLQVGDQVKAGTSFPYFSEGRLYHNTLKENGKVIHIDSCTIQILSEK